MSESDDDPLIARVAGELRRPVPLSPDFDARVMAAVRRAPPAPPACAPGRGSASRARWRSRRWAGSRWRRGSRGWCSSGMWGAAAGGGQPSAVSRQPSAVGGAAGAP